jgi:putative flavoprotein involved in K+ transport
MPEVHFQVSWPDGFVQQCTSPSRAIEAHLAPGASYPVGEFVRRVQEGMDAASERVRQQYGMACSAAMAQREQVEMAARAHAPDGDGLVRVHYLRRGAAGRSATQRPFRGATASKLNGHVPVVVGGGQAGLAMSWNLTQEGVGHVVLERHTVAHSWKEDRWESFCLVTPNWQCTRPATPTPATTPTASWSRTTSSTTSSPTPPRSTRPCTRA